MNSNTQTEEPDDLALIQRINQGDGSAFEILYKRHKEWVFRMACRVLGGPQHADDVTQEVFCYLLSKFPGFKLTCALRTFLYPAVRNQSLNAIKKARRYDGGPNSEAYLESLPAPAAPSGSLDGLEEFVSALSENHREVLLLRFVDGMTVPEIAELISVPEGTVKSRIHHAISALRNRPEIRGMMEKSERIEAPNC